MAEQQKEKYIFRKNEKVCDKIFVFELNGSTFDPRKMNVYFSLLVEHEIPFFFHLIDLAEGCVRYKKKLDSAT